MASQLPRPPNLKPALSRQASGGFSRSPTFSRNRSLVPLTAEEGAPVVKRNEEHGAVVLRVRNPQSGPRRVTRQTIFRERRNHPRRTHKQGSLTPRRSSLTNRNQQFFPINVQVFELRKGDLRPGRRHPFAAAENFFDHFFSSSEHLVCVSREQIRSRNAQNTE